MAMAKMAKMSAMKGMKKVNEFFKLMTDARKKDLASFMYKGKTYKKKQMGHLTFYKA